VSYFTVEELKCRHCGAYVFDEDFLSLLNEIREECGFPLPVSSGYRCPDHPLEAQKEEPGAHCSGKAVDIAVSYDRAHRLMQVAFSRGVKRIGVNQRGDEGRFIHLDNDTDLPGPTIWSY